MRLHAFACSFYSSLSLSNTLFSMFRTYHSTHTLHTLPHAPTHTPRRPHLIYPHACTSGTTFIFGWTPRTATAPTYTRPAPLPCFQAWLQAGTCRSAGVCDAFKFLAHRGYTLPATRRHYHPRMGRISAAHLVFTLRTYLRERRTPQNLLPATLLRIYCAAHGAALFRVPGDIALMLRTPLPLGDAGIRLPARRDAFLLPSTHCSPFHLSQTFIWTTVVRLCLPPTHFAAPPPPPPPPSLPFGYRGGRASGALYLTQGVIPGGQAVAFRCERHIPPGKPPTTTFPRHYGSFSALPRRTRA